MATESLALWDRFAAEIGEDLGFRRCGLLYLSNDDAQLAGWAKWRDFAARQGVVTHMLSAEEAKQLLLDSVRENNAQLVDTITP